MSVQTKVTSNTGATLEGTFDEIHGSTYLERDSHGLARLGKSQVLKVCFKYLNRHPFGYSAVCLWGLLLYQTLTDDDRNFVATIWVSLHFWLQLLYPRYVGDGIGVRNQQLLVFPNIIMLILRFQGS